MIFRSSSLNFPYGLGVIRSTSGVVRSEGEEEEKGEKKIKTRK
jgi:hypothetical protein